MSQNHNRLQLLINISGTCKTFEPKYLNTLQTFWQIWCKDVAAFWQMIHKNYVNHCRHLMINVGVILSVSASTESD